MLKHAKIQGLFVEHCDELSLLSVDAGGVHPRQVWAAAMAGCWRLLPGNNTGRWSRRAQRGAHPGPGPGQEHQGGEKCREGIYGQYNASFVKQYSKLM